MKKTILYAASAGIFLFSSCTSTPKQEVSAENTVQPAPVEPEPMQQDIEEPEVYDLPPEQPETQPSEAADEKLEKIEIAGENAPVSKEAVPEPAQPQNAIPAETEPATFSKDIASKNETQMSKPAMPPKTAATVQQSDTQEEPSEASPAATASSPALAETAETIAETAAPAAPVPSRSVQIKRNQYLDVIYPGSGWIYMGETEKEKKMVFFGRKIATENTSFTMRSRFAGTTMLHFYKNDILTGSYIDDYLEVIIEDDIAEVPSEHVQAPSYADIVPPAPDRSLLAEAKPDITENTASSTEKNVMSANTANSSTAASTADTAAKTAAASAANRSATQPEKANNASAPAKTVIQNTDTAAQNTENTEPPASSVISGTKAASPKTENAGTPKAVPQINTDSMNSSDILKQAQTAYDSKQYEQAFSLLTDFFEKADSEIDKALYLQGQTLEAKSPIQNIKSAIDAYESIIRNYPQSRFWKAANERSMYLKRFYIDIR